MKIVIRGLALVFLFVLFPLRWASAFDCVEVFPFEIDRNDFSSRESERAAAMPQEFLDVFQHATVGEIIRSKSGLTAVKGGENACPDSEQAVQFGGTVTDFKEGNQAMRYFVGFGAGKQKLAVYAWLRNKTTGEIIFEDKIVDRKWAGFGGGDDRKGVRDFAEKVVVFLRKGLGLPKK